MGAGATTISGSYAVSDTTNIENFIYYGNNIECF